MIFEIKVILLILSCINQLNTEEYKVSHENQQKLKLIHF